MNEEPTTAVIQRFLDALQGDADVEPLIRALLKRAVRRLRLLWASLLQRSYPRLTQPPLNLETDGLLDGVLGGLLAALRGGPPADRRRSDSVWKPRSCLLLRTMWGSIAPMENK
jgi:RNA polymerase sigma-70 factor (ECF subfamily)